MQCNFLLYPLKEDCKRNTERKKKKGMEIKVENKHDDIYDESTPYKYLYTQAEYTR